MTRPLLVLSLAATLFTACGTTTPTTEDAGADAGAAVDAGVADAGVDAGYVADPLVVERPFDVVVPVGYQRGTPLPLVVLLHGYTATAAQQDTYFGLSALAQQRTFLLALPNGTVDERSQQFWNATDACCGFGKTVDDVAYLTAVVNDVKARFSVDPKRVFLVGHSNGAFMSHRLACERSAIFGGIVSLAGAVWADGSKCNPTEPVNILQVHGTLDTVIQYTGGTALVGQPPYPSAADTVKTWAQKNGCTGTALTDIAGNLDLDTALLLSETRREEFSGCPAGGGVELWSIQGGSHLPAFNGAWADTIYSWLQAHPKP